MTLNLKRRIYFRNIIVTSKARDIMAGSLAVVKKELRKKIRDILKKLTESAAASQSTYDDHFYFSWIFTFRSVECH